MHWVAWSLVANVAIIGLEYMYRMVDYRSFWDGLPHFVLPILATQLALYYMFKDAPSYLLAWAAFTVGNTVLRLMSNHWFIGDKMNWMIMAGVSVIVLGTFLIKEGQSI